MATNQDPSLSWSEQLQEENLTSQLGQDEFSNFLEFGLDLSALGGNGMGTNHDQRQQNQHGVQEMQNESVIPTSMEDVAMGRPDQQVHGHYNPGMAAMTMGMESHPQKPFMNSNVDHQYYNPEQGNMSHQVYGQQGHTVIPPTPSSMELGGAARYPQRVEGNDPPSGYDRYAHMGEEQSYTPLISPSMTPLDTSFRLPEYAIPGEYFTPLTSPALEARNSNSGGYMEARNANSGGYIVPTTQSLERGFNAVDLSSQLAWTSAPSSPGFTRKTRRKPSLSTHSSIKGVGKSPSVRPQHKRRPQTSGGIRTDEHPHGGSHDATANKYLSGVIPQSGTESSGQDSVSPEPLSEPLMPPPSLPQTRKSPNIWPQAPRPESQGNEPATPATLMRLQRKVPRDATTRSSGPSSLVINESAEEPMEDIMLPESMADSRPGLAPIDTSLRTIEPAPPSAVSSKDTPTGETRKAESTTESAAVTPQFEGFASPSGPVAKSKSTPRLARKRQSVSSAVSPALRPKISPNIQPLIRGTDGMSSDSPALYLASKSNYQHILEGTLLPGVSYPDALAENLSSKRTNHKLAEQGRRNRINTALKEIEGLLPKNLAEKSKECSEEGEGMNENSKSDKAGNQTTSKASTVEMAIVYIKALKLELEQTQARLQAAEAKLGKHGSARDVESEKQEMTEMKDTNTPS